MVKLREKVGSFLLFDVDCWITFRAQIIKFAMSNPDFNGFSKMRKLINDLTVCPKLPQGVVKAMW